jgi:iron complex outermembrane receptor protein
MANRGRYTHARLMCGAAMLALLGGAGTAVAQETAQFNIAPQPLASALNEFAVQSPWPILYTSQMTGGKTTAGVSGATDPQLALNTLLAGTGLSYRREGDTFLIVRADADPQGGSAAGGGAEVEGLIVTAQKREEDIQDVPIAMSAFSQEALERSQIAGGPDLMTQIPNMTFTKTNFASYSIQIRGIGTQAISATTDAAVAVAFNNTPFIRNRFFEQEFYDLQRVEVLRGPQGTLYGRNATAGVVNVISAKPKFVYEAKVSADVANYGSNRLEGMVNIPLVEDVVALRLAGAWTKRDGFVMNQITGSPIDGRDLWSTRMSLRFAPSDTIEANLIYEHFEEDDDRLRSGKQVCSTDDRTEINGLPSRREDLYYAEAFSQGCLPQSMYAPESYRAPDGFSLPYYHAMRLIGLPTVPGFNPYASTTQSRDLRVIESTIDPEYQAKSDLAELQFDIDLTDTLTLTSETAYSTDELFSMQDFNRFNTASGAFGEVPQGSDPNILKDGVFCDPQIGCADRLVAMDLSTAKSRQFSQEIRIGSDFDGPFNFSLGANYLRYDTEDKYYVFINTVGLLTAIRGYGTYIPNVSDNSECMPEFVREPDVNGFEYISGCIYMDPNSIHNLNDKGHNYFLSKNPYKLISYAAFGEMYYNVTPDLKVTAGFRWTVDKKDAPRIPSWLMATNTVGYPVAEVIEQEWRAPTGRLAVDWKPSLSFTDETLLYASYAHGYKAGGANPPAAGVVTWSDEDAIVLSENSVTQPKTFDPEFVDAFEVGAKNTLLDGALTLNLGAFYYDYEGYQVSYIVNRSAVNLNFDAEVWGAEIEADWRPTENLKLGFKGGYEKTRVADGEQAIDTMDRTAGNPDWVVVRPFPAYPSNCIVPVYAVKVFTGFNGDNSYGLGFPPNVYANGHGGPCEFAYLQGLDPVTGVPYVPNPRWGSPGQPAWRWFNGPLTAYFPDYPGFDPTTAPNNGEGFFKDLSGNELPNAPHFTGTLTADYTVPLRGEWLVNLHADFYYQSEAWTRIFNTDGYDKLKAYTNINLAATFTNDDAGWKVMAYVKNVMDRDSITGAFLLSDDTALVTNVFLNEPRLYGLRITKEWSAGGFGWLGEGRERTPGAPYPFHVELGAAASHFSADNEPYTPDWLADNLATLGDTRSAHTEDLDWGDTRDIKLTYAPGGGWAASAAYRVGKTNGFNRTKAVDAVPGGEFGISFLDHDNYALSEVNDSEAHTIVDFMIGKEIGLGRFGEGGRSEIAAGLRYAKFESLSRVTIDGATEMYIAPVLDVKYPDIHFNTFSMALASQSEFEGVGPSVSWDSSLRLAGEEETGHADLDWSVGGGVLFGKQNVNSTEEREGEYVHPSDIPFGAAIRDNLYPDSPLIERHRTKDVTAPTLSLSVGLSYSIDRVRISTGYSYDRFFNAIDGGIDEAQQFDRTIHGPYLKLSLGFGG